MRDPYQPMLVAGNRIAFMEDPEQSDANRADCMSCRFVRVATMAGLSGYSFVNYYALPNGSTGRAPLLIVSGCAGALAVYSMLR